MHFLRAGRDLVDPLVIGDALVRVIHKRPSADASLFLNEATGETAVTIPWGSVEEAQTRLMEFVHGSVVIHKRLQEAVLSAYVENPTTGAWLRIPREYWFKHPPGGDYRLLPIEGATGWDEALHGQPIVVDTADLPRWEKVADEAIAMLQRPSAEERALEAPQRIPASPKWHRQTKETDAHRKLIAILSEADKRGMLLGQSNHRSLQWLHERYVTACRDNKKITGDPAPIEPLKFSAFKKWTERYRKGEWGGRPKEDAADSGE